MEAASSTVCTTSHWAAGKASTSTVTSCCAPCAAPAAAGGGYGAGNSPASWYTWSSLDGTDTTSADSSDRGTPGAANSDPDIFDHFTLVFDPAEPRIIGAAHGAAGVIEYARAVGILEQDGVVPGRELTILRRVNDLRIETVRETARSS